MNNPQTINLENVIPLFVSTYQGSSTSQINDAYHMLLQTAKRSSNPFINTCQKILETQTNNHHLCQSVSNFIKVMTKIMIDNGFVSETGPKDFINKIQNLFDNDKISLQYKENIALSFIKAAFHFRQSFQKIIGRISFLYNTKQIQKAVLLSRAYLASQSRLDAKSQNFYYNKILKLQIINLSQEILSLRKLLSEGNEQHFDMAQVKVKNIHELLKNIHSALVFTAFQKFQSSIFKCLEGKDIINIVNSLQIFKQNHKILILLRELIQKVLESLFRMRRIHKIPELMKAISQNLHSEWKQFQQNLLNRNSLIYKGVSTASGLELEKEISQIKLITAGLNSRIILILDDSFDILNVLVHPLFEIRTQIFQKNQNDVKETFLLFEDTCFSMKSECMEVEFNRLVKSLLVNYEIISSKVYLTFDEVLFNNSSFEDFFASNQNTVILLLSLLTFQASYFMTNTTLMKKVQTFLIKHQKLLFSMSNAELYFHSLLILFNFLDDLFFEELDTHIFQMISQNFISNKTQINQGTSNNQLIVQFEKKILKSFYQRGFANKQVQKEYFILIQYLTTTFDEDAVQIYINVMKNYNIEDKITLEIFDKMFQSINYIASNNLIINSESHEKIHVFVKFLETFFDLDIYKYLFESTLSRILPIFGILIQNADLFMDEFFSIIKNAVRHLEYVPENYYSWMTNLFTSQKLQNQESFYSLVSILKYASPSRQVQTFKFEAFVNFTALSLVQTIYESLKAYHQNQQQPNTTQVFARIQNSQLFFAKPQKSDYSKRQILCLLTLHQLIYYHSGYLTRKTLEKIILFSSTQMGIADQNQMNEERLQKKDLKFSFVQGKYQLLFVMLFRRRLADVNQILTKLTIETNVYNAVYMRDYHYLIEYDTSILIKEQAEILKKFMVQDKLQMACANTSFLVIFYKFCILYELKNKQKHKRSQYFDMDSSDSDEEEFQVITEFKTNFKDVAKIVKNFPLPQEWSQINQLKEIKEFIQMIRSNESTREWLNLLISNCMTKDQRKLMEDLMKDLENVNGTYRHIVKVNKNALSSPNKQQNI